MLNRLLVAFLGIGLTVMLGCRAGEVRSLEDQGGEVLVLAGATVFPSPTEAPLHDSVVVVEGDRIAAVGGRGEVRVPLGARWVDCSGLTITAGFWNSHVHFFERKWADISAIPTGELGRQLLETFLRYGFTSVFDLSSPRENTRRLGDRIDSGEVPGPRIKSTGEGFVPPGAMPSKAVLGVMGIMAMPLPEVSSAEEARAEARRLLGEGVDGIKLFLSSQRGELLAEGVLEAAVEEARRVKRPVFVHPNSGADVRAGILGRVDVIAHTTPTTGPWGAGVLEGLRRQRTALTPTLALWKHFARHDRLATQDRIVATALDQLRAWRAEGGVVLFGTDLGAVGEDPREEYALMAASGMNFREILTSLTTAPAAQFGEALVRGRVAVGFLADLVVLAGDPVRDPRALASVRYTLRDGKIIYATAE